MYYEPRKEVRNTALAAEVQEQFGDKLFCSHPPHMQPNSKEWDGRAKTLGNLYKWAREACESTRASLDEDATIPSWLPELEAAVKGCEVKS